MKLKRRGKLTKGVVFHQDNAPAHTSAVAMAAIHGCGFEILSHPLYSPDLAPSGFHLFFIFYFISPNDNSFRQ